jgi:predicted N-acetyltransferase YhbS
MLGPLAVEPVLQGKGLGRMLMDHTLQLAGELGTSW